MAKNLSVKSYNQELLVDGDPKLLSKIPSHPFFLNYIPESSHAWVSGDAELFIEEGQSTSFVHSGKISKLTIGQDSRLSIEDIITVVDYCLDYKRQLEGVYVIHGSASAQNSKGVIFFGPISGIGKTSLNLHMCQRYNFGFIGDEKILISSQGYIVGGTKSVYFNKQEMFKWLDKDLHNKDMRTAGKLNMASEQASCTIFIQPVITSGGSNLVVTKWDEAKADWHLYEELTRKIRGISRRISNYTIGLQSLDNQELTQKRITAVKSITKSAQFYLILGSKDSISQYIYESIFKN